MPKVIHVTNDVSDASGVGTFVRRIHAELKALGVASSVVTRTEDLPTGTDSGEPPLVHIHGLWLGLHHAASAWAHARNLPVVWSTHGMTAPWSMRHKRWKKLPAWFLYQRRDLRAADLVHATGENEFAWNARLGLGRQCVVPLGTDLPSHAATPPETLGSRTLLFVGRLYPVKALDNLIRAFALACAKSPKAKGWNLRLVGPDQAGHRAELEGLCASLGLDALRVAFAGPRYGDDLTHEYDACAALALVSHTENFGATVVDAMAHGKPVVTSVNTPWKVVSERGAGWWTANDPDTLAATLAELFATSEATLREMGARGRTLVEERFTWPAVGKAMLRAYEDVLRRDER